MRFETFQQLEHPKQTSALGCVAASTAMALSALGDSVPVAQLDKIMGRRYNKLPDQVGITKLDCALMNRGYKLRHLQPKQDPSALDFSDARSYREAYAKAISKQAADWIDETSFAHCQIAERMALPYERKGRLSHATAPMNIDTFRRSLGRGSVLLATSDEGYHQIALFTHYRGEPVAEDYKAEVCIYDSVNRNKNDLGMYYFNELSRCIYKPYGFTIISR